MWRYNTSESTVKRGSAQCADPLIGLVELQGDLTNSKAPTGGRQPPMAAGDTGL